MNLLTDGAKLDQNNDFYGDTDSSKNIISSVGAVDRSWLEKKVDQKYCFSAKEIMGNVLNQPKDFSQINVPNPADIKGAHPMKDPSFDPNFGFPNGRKERGLLI